MLAADKQRSRNTLMEWLRSRLPPSARRRVRAFTDPIAGPFGSIRGVRTSDRALGLTFDDGPDPAFTPAILDVLSANNAKATWFVLVDRAESNPKLTRRILSEGHDIGLHGLDHRRLTRLPRRDLARHISEGVTRLSQLTGRSIRFFRPPYGAQSLSSYLAVRRQGMESIVWSADCDDWSPHPEGIIAARAIGAAAPGSILLLHDSLAADPSMPVREVNLDRRKLVELIAQGLESNGMRSVSLSELLRLGSAHRTMWFRP